MTELADGILMPDELSAHLAFLNALIHTYTITLFLTEIYRSQAV
jgi:hypothetical protein